jgi:hypothetical protein
MKLHIQNCTDLIFKSRESFDKWYLSYEFRSYSLDKSEAECSCLAYYLHALINTKDSCVSWPIKCKKSESPDFQVSLGAEQLGLEHSTITSTKYQQFRAEGIRNPKQQILWSDSFRIGGPPEKDYNSGWVGDGVEQEWTQLAILRIIDKFGKLNKQHFTKFNRNELVLNTVSYLPNIDMQRAIVLLGPEINAKLSTLEFAHSFDSISLIYGTKTFPHAFARSTK